MYGDTQELVSKKVQEAEDCQLSVIYCCGENSQDRQNDEQEKVISEQLQALKDANIEDWSRVIIAYEPLWAMGTGDIASADQTQEVAFFIRNWIRENIGS
jgi:triosephosphate isomerase